MAIQPLGDQDHKIAKDTVDTTPEILEFLRKCEACGLPVDDRVQAVQTQCDFCKAVLENFFPDRQ